MQKKEEILTLEKIKEKLEKEKDKKEFLKQFIKNKEYNDIRKDLVKLAYPEVIKNPEKEFNLTYDAFSEGLEPIYFWLLDFLRDSAPGGLGFDVKKGEENYEASVSSGYFSEIGGKKTQMQQKAAEYLGAINQVIKSIINLIYDLKEFDIRLKHYDDYRSDDKERKSNGRIALKFVWMDQVDVKNGAGSINGLAQNLNFTTLRSGFLQLDGETEEELKKYDMNENVKTIIRKKFDDFFTWLDYSEEEIRNRYTIEKSYLKSQVGTLKLYAKWAKPYLVAAQKLNMKEFNTPDIVNAFSNMQMDLELFGKKEIKPESVNPNFKEIKTERKFYAVVRIFLKFRTIPQSVSGQGGRQYVHGGRTDIIIQAFGMDDIDLNILESKELYEDMELIDQWVNVSLETLEKELDKFIHDKKEEKKEEKKESKLNHGFDNPFKGVFNEFSGMFSPLKELVKPKPKESILYKETLKEAINSSKLNCDILYKVYKKTHGMLATD